MFPFDYTEYPQQTFLPNLHSSPCNFSHERLNPFHHQNYIPHQMGIFLPQTVLNQDLNSNTITQDGCPFPYNPSEAYEFTCNNQASLGLSSSKKDRHTKISTAHGVRDRRVRLSMAIAREFFDLQDLLGFDKASKTIGWLLSKSKAAIQELVLTKRDSGLSRSNSMYDSQEEDAIATSAMMRMATRKRSGSDTFASANSSQEEIERFSVENQASSIVARENRTKARARARERTKEKLSTMANPNQFDDLGFQTSCSSHLLPGFKPQDFSRSLHLTEKEGCSSDLQNLNGLNTTKADQDGPTRVNNLPNLLLVSNYNDGSSATTSSSFSGWNIFTPQAEMHMSTVKPWDNHVQKQHR